jgi:hypothetical protein
VEDRTRLDKRFDTAREQLPEGPSLSERFDAARAELPDEPTVKKQGESGGIIDTLGSYALRLAPVFNPESVSRRVAQKVSEGEVGLPDVQSTLQQVNKMFWTGRAQAGLEDAMDLFARADAKEEGGMLKPGGRLGLGVHRDHRTAEEIEQAGSEAARQALDQLEDANRMTGHPGVEKASRQLAGEDFSGALDTFIEQPGTLPALGAGVMAQQADALAMGTALTVAGGFMAPFALGGSGGALVGQLANTGLTTSAMEQRVGIQETLREQGVNLSSEEDVLRKLSNPNFRDEVASRARERGIAYGTVEGLGALATFGLANSVLAKPLTTIASGTAQIAAEGGGEAAAQLTHKNEVRPGEVALEMIASGPMAAVEAGTQLASGEAGGDGAAPSSSIRQRIQQLREQVPDDPDAPAPDRPLADMDDQALENARERALDQADQETVQLIDEELQTREDQEAESPTDDDGQLQGPGSAPEGQRNSMGATPRADRDTGAGRVTSSPQPQKTPSQIPEQDQARVLARIEAARSRLDRMQRAEQELGLGDMPEDPAPEIDARREETPETDERSSRQRESQQGGERGAQDDAVASDAEPAPPSAANADDGDAGPSEGAPSQPDSDGRRRAAGAQGELAPDLGVRPETRPEEQVSEAVEEARGEVQRAEEQVAELEQQLRDAVAEEDPETVAQLARATDSERVETLLRSELEKRGDTGDLFGGEATPQQQGESQGLFGQEGTSTSGLERAARRLEQREAGLQDARERLLEREQRQEQVRSRAREQQQDLELPESDETAAEGTNVDVTPEEAQDMNVDELAEVGEEAAANDNVDQEEVILQELQKRAEAQDGPAVEFRPQSTEDPGRMTLSRITEQGREEVEATVTEGAVRLESADVSPETLRAAVDEAARRDRRVETPAEVPTETAQALYRLSEEGYEVTRASSAAEAAGTVEADGEPALRIRAPRFEGSAPTLQAENGRRVGRAARSVERETAQSARSDAFENVSEEELRSQLEEAEADGNAEQVQRLQSELERRQTPPTQTTYRHSEGDLVVTDENGNFIDRRSNGYDEAVAEYMAEHESELREGSVEATEGDYTRRVSQGSYSPQQILEAYQVQRERVRQEEPDPQTRMIDATGRFSTDSFDEYADPNWRQDDGQLTMSWLGGDTSLDQRAREITQATGVETTPQDIVEHITENPEGPNARTDAKRTLDALQERFQEVTGVRLTDMLADLVQEQQTERLGGDGRDTDPPPINDENPFRSDRDDLFSPEGDAPFRRVAEEGAGTSSADLVEVYLRRFASELGAEVTVVNDPSELEGLPGRAYRLGQERVGEGFTQPAMFFDPPGREPQVFVIAADVEASARATGADVETFARQTLMHETVAHQGLRGLLGDEFGATMDELFEAIGRGRLLNARTADGTRLADAYAPELEVGEDGRLTPQSRRLLVEEYLARVAEDMTVPGSTLQRIFRRLRDAIKRAFGVEVTETELRTLLSAARDHLRAGQHDRPIGGTRFSRQGSAATPAMRWMMIGTQAETFDAAQDQGRTFFGPFDNEARAELSDADAQWRPDGPIQQLVEAGRQKNRLVLEDAPTDIEGATRRRYEALSRLDEGVPLEDVLAHRSLYEAYPALGEDVTVTIDALPEGTAASYNPDTDAITLNRGRLFAIERMEAGDAAARLEEALRSLLHEVQHAVQDREGFAQGTHPTATAAAVQREVDSAGTTYVQFRRASDALSVKRIANREGISVKDALGQYARIQERKPERKLPVQSDLVQRAAENNTLNELKERRSEFEASLNEAGLNPRRPRHRQVLRGNAGARERFVRQEAVRRYQQSAGEVEARFTQERRNIPQEGRATTTADVRQNIDVDATGVTARFERVAEPPDPQSPHQAPSSGPQNLVTLHNLSAEGVRFAVEHMSGRIPMPSLATVRSEHGFDSFGNISLIAPPELADPENGVSTFEGDAYTPKTPSPEFSPDVGAWMESDLRDKINAAVDVLRGQHHRDDTLDYHVGEGNRERFYAALAKKPEGWWAFAQREGLDIDPGALPDSEYQGEHAGVLRNGLADFLRSLGEMDRKDLARRAATPSANEFDPQLAQDLADAYRSAVEAKVADIRPAEDRQALADSIVGHVTTDNGILTFDDADTLRRSFRNFERFEPGVDREAFRERAQEAIQEFFSTESWRETRAELEAYWREQVDPFGEPMLDAEKGIPYHIDQIVAAMEEQGLQGAEGLGGTISQLVGAQRNEFDSLEAMQRARDRIDPGAYSQALSRLESDVRALAGEMEQNHRSSTPRPFALHEALADFMGRRRTATQAREALRRNGYEGASAEQIQAFMQLAGDLEKTPAQYFESKPDRAVSLSEFEAAIVPSDASRDVVEALEDEVGRVATYEPGDSADRQQVLATESERAGVRFSRVEEDPPAGSRFQREQVLSDERAEGDVPPNPNAYTVDWSPQNLARVTKKLFREWLAQRSLLPEEVFDAKLERDGSLDAAMERVRFTLRDFGEALEQAFGADPTAEQVRQVNEALQNGYREDVDPTQGELFVPDAKEGTVTRANPPALFGSDPPMAPSLAPGERQTLADMTFIEDLPEPLQEVVGRMRDQVDALSRMGIRAGLFRGDLKVTVTENLGTYLTRQYKVHQEEDFGQLLRQAVRDSDAEGITIDPDDVPGSLQEMGVEADTWNRAVAAMRDLRPGMSDERILGELFRMIGDPEPGGIYEGGSQLGSVGQSIFERRKDIPGPLRELMGQIHDPAENYMASMHKMLHAVTNQKFLNQVKKAGLGEWLHREPKVENGVEYTAQVAAEGSRTMRPLNGLYTTPEIKQAFETFDEHNSGGPVYRTYMKLVGTVKEALTVFSAKLQVRNYTSAFGFGLSQGHLFAGRDYLQAYRKAHPISWNRIFKQEDTEAQREMIQKMQRLNIIDEAPRVGDIEDTWRDAGQLMGDPMEGVDNLAAKIVQRIDQGARRAYQAGDNVHKIAGFLIERQRYRDAYPDKSEEQIDELAAQRIRNTFPTYSLVPKAVRRLRANPYFSSFPSFFAEIVRNRANTLLAIKEDLSDPRTRSIGIQRAAGEMIKASVWAGIMAGGKALTGIGDDEEDLIRRHMPSWERYSYHFYHSRDEEAGTISYVDIGYLNPDATLHEPVMRLLAGEKIDEQGWAHVAGYRFLEPFVSPEILTQSTVEAVTNARLENLTSQGNIYNPQLPTRRKIEEGAKHVAKDFIPGTLTQANQTWQAFAQDPEFGEDPPTKVEAIAEPLTGQNMRTIDFANSLKWKTINLDNKLSDARSLWFTSVVQRGEVTKDDLEEALRNSLDAQQEAIEAAHTDLISAQVAGVSEKRALAILQANGLSKRDAIDVLDGRFRPRPDYNMLQGQIASERATGNEQDAQLLEERNELVQEVLDEVVPEYRQPNDEAQREATEERLNQSE